MHLSERSSKRGRCFICGLPVPDRLRLAFRSGNVPKEVIQNKFKDQVDIFVKNDADLLIAEYFSYVEEAELAVEVMKSSGKPTAVTMAVSLHGDESGVAAGECAVRLARAGADIVGVNCRFDPNMSLATMALMKESLHREGLQPYLIVQPVGYWTFGSDSLGLATLPECPFALESRTLTRWDCHKFARQAYDLGIRYIGGCCGFEPYHIRALAEELASERGRLPDASAKHSLWATDLQFHIDEHMRQKASREYWENLKPRLYTPSATNRNEGQ